MRHALLRHVMFMVVCSVSRAFVLPAPVVLRIAGSSNTVRQEQATTQPGARVVLHQQANADEAPEGSLMLIEVTKKHAKVFKSVAKGSVAEMVAPVDEWRLHEAGNAEHRSQGLGKHHAEKVDPLANSRYLIKFYMDELLDDINSADSVLLVGHGHGKANLAEGLAAALYDHQPNLTEKIENVLRLDGKHITQNQLLALGRRHLLHAEDPRRPV